MVTFSLLFMAKPPAEVRQAMLRTMEDKGWARALGDALSKPENWHQSLSHPVDGSSLLREAMLVLGSRVTAVAFTMVFNRVVGNSGSDGNIHWAFHARGAPRPLAELVAALRRGLEVLGLEDMPGHRPHATVSYRAPHRLPSTPILPIAWRVDELLLVETRGRGDGYHYHPLASWPLRPVPPGLESQRELW